jgi:hypothetical protein
MADAPSRRTVPVTDSFAPPRAGWFLPFPRPAAIVLLLAPLVACAGVGTTSPDATPTPVSDTSHRYPPSKWVLGPIYATGCPRWGECGSGNDMASEVNADLDQLAAHDIRITAYHFDGDGWSSGGCTWALGSRLIDRLRSANLRAILHVWGGCDTDERIRNVYSRLGNVFGALYLDEGSTDQTARSAFDLMRSLFPAEGEVVMKAYQSDHLQTDAGLATIGHTAYVGDVASDFAAMRAAIERVFAKSTLLPAPFSEFTGYDSHAVPSEEAYFRRLHWGAMQMVMDQDCARDCDPWGSRTASYSQALLSAFRRYSWLHAELVPYLHSYDYQMYETGSPVFRDSDPAGYTTRLGDELFAAYVTQPGVVSLAIALPPGEWINYWNDDELFSGSSTIDYPVPLGREPIFVRNGAIIPMQVSRNYTGHGTAGSAGSLTVVVYPSGDSRFSYRDDGYWVNFTSSLVDTALTLDASPAPSQPLLYRIGRWTSEPASVAVNGTTVTVNQDGGAVRVNSEDAVNTAPFNAWFYDDAAQRLIVKAINQAAATVRQEAGIAAPVGIATPRRPPR